MRIYVEWESSLVGSYRAARESERHREDLFEADAELLAAYEQAAKLFFEAEDRLREAHEKYRNASAKGTDGAA